MLAVTDVNRFHVCVPYYSLPEFPESCRLVRIHDILPRDVLLCNPNNNIHRQIGFQLDPAIEYGQYRVCEPKVRQGLKARAARYDTLYLLFRTRSIGLDDPPRIVVSGFFEVSKCFPEGNTDEPIVTARKMRFVSRAHAIDITERLRSSGAFRCTPTSENAVWRGDLERWVSLLQSKRNRADDYVELTKDLKAAFKRNEFKYDRYAECDSCEYLTGFRPKCPLVRRQNLWPIADVSR